MTKIASLIWILALTAYDPANAVALETGTLMPIANATWQMDSEALLLPAQQIHPTTLSSRPHRKANPVEGDGSAASLWRFPTHTPNAVSDSPARPAAR